MALKTLALIPDSLKMYFIYTTVVFVNANVAKARILTQNMGTSELSASSEMEASAFYGTMFGLLNILTCNCACAGRVSSKLSLSYGGDNDSLMGLADFINPPSDGV